MPLIKSCEKEALQRNVAEPDQAAAIAYQVCREKRKQDAKELDEEMKTMMGYVKP